MIVESKSTKIDAEKGVLNYRYAHLIRVAHPESVRTAVVFAFNVSLIAKCKGISAEGGQSARTQLT